MKNRILCALALLALPFGALILPSRGNSAILEPGSVPSSALAQTYSVDGVHSSMIFRVKHLDVAYFYGAFRGLEGTVEFDPEDASKCSIQVTVAAASIDTGDKSRDRHLKSGDFFNAEEFPSIEFKSKQVAKKDGDVFEVIGELTLHGVTKELKCEVELTGQVDTERGAKAGFETTFEIQRGDFGMDYMLGKGLGNEVRVTLSLECNQK